MYSSVVYLDQARTKIYVASTFIPEKISGIIIDKANRLIEIFREQLLTV